MIDFDEVPQKVQQRVPQSFHRYKVIAFMIHAGLWIIPGSLFFLFYPPDSIFSSFWEILLIPPLIALFICCVIFLSKWILVMMVHHLTGPPPNGPDGLILRLLIIGLGFFLSNILVYYILKNNLGRPPTFIETTSSLSIAYTLIHLLIDYVVKRVLKS